MICELFWWEPVPGGNLIHDMNCCWAPFLYLCLLVSQSRTAEASQETLHWMEKMEVAAKSRISTSSAELIHGLELRLLNASFGGHNLTLQTQIIQALAFKLNCNFSGLSLSSAALEKVPQARPQHAMQFPAELTRNACRTRSRDLRLICIYFSSTRFFQSALLLLPFQKDINSSLLNNYVLGAQLSHGYVSNLSEPVNISFWHNQSLEGYTVTCVFWKERASKHHWGAWSPEGCHTEQPTPSQVLCRCNHLTYFAVLMQLSQAPVPAELLAPLTYISLVGCSISIVASLLTVLLHLQARYSPALMQGLLPSAAQNASFFSTWPRESQVGFPGRQKAGGGGVEAGDQPHCVWLLLGPCPSLLTRVQVIMCLRAQGAALPGDIQVAEGHAPTRRKQSDSVTRIHMNLHSSVLLLNITFLLSPVLATPPMPGAACVVLAATLHFALLSCLTWMAIEGFNLYLLLGRVYNVYIRRYVLKLCAVGWGVPAFLVLFLLAVKSSVYGPCKIQLSDSHGNSTGFKTTSICWVQSSWVHSVLVMGYGGLTSLFNLVVLAWALRVLNKLRAQEKAPGTRACRDTVTVLGLTVLLGTTWALAFFSFSVFLLPQLFLFTIFNSLYGFFLFLWFCSQRCRSEAEAEAEMEVFTSQMVQ
ncbi:adhesion G-protein coupled receptor G5 isoform X3 [Bos indicus]|uniref:Adhesion G-protein coupled receptor G5 isoform X3 n=1 Tax=Bos indicus TaxID=9915 RepID=A0ABM4QTV9_BOSIN